MVKLYDRIQCKIVIVEFWIKEKKIINLMEKYFYRLFKIILKWFGCE